MICKFLKCIPALLLILLCGNSFAAVANFTSTDIPKDIPDNSSASSVINVPSGGSVQDVNVGLTLTHWWIEDIAITLISPDGTRVLLSDANGGSGEDYAATVFDDDAQLPITSGTAPFTGTFIPEENLSKLNNLSSIGNWYLEISDNYLDGFGASLENWHITVEYSSASRTIAVSSGEGGAISPPHTLTVPEGSNNTFTITPEPNYHIVDVQVNGTSVGAVSSYTFTNITADASISAFFALDAPTILSISPTTGPVTGGTSVIITGTNFGSTQETGSVTFGEVNTTITSWSDTEIVCIAPVNPGGIVDITVNRDSSNSYTLATSFTYDATFDYDKNGNVDGVDLSVFKNITNFPDGLIEQFAQWYGREWQTVSTHFPSDNPTIAEEIYNGEIFSFIGVKDTNGDATSITSINQIPEDGSWKMTYELDNTGRLTSITGKENVLTFTYLANNQVQITAVGPNGEQESIISDLPVQSDLASSPVSIISGLTVQSDPASSPVSMQSGATELSTCEGASFWRPTSEIMTGEVVLQCDDHIDRAKDVNVTIKSEQYQSIYNSPKYSVNTTLKSSEGTTDIYEYPFRAEFRDAPATYEIYKCGCDAQVRSARIVISEIKDKVDMATALAGLMSKITWDTGEWVIDKAKEFTLNIAKEAANGTGFKITLPTVEDLLCNPSVYEWYRDNASLHADSTFVADVKWPNGDVSTSAQETFNYYEQSQIPYLYIGPTTPNFPEPEAKITKGPSSNNSPGPPPFYFEYLGIHSYPYRPDCPSCSNYTFRLYKEDGTLVETWDKNTTAYGVIEQPGKYVLRLEFVTLNGGETIEEEIVVLGGCVENGDGTVMKNGLMWQQNDSELIYPYEAENYCNNLVLAGHSDWRLPTKDELKGLVVCSNGKNTPLADWDYNKSYEQNLIDATCGGAGWGSYTAPTWDSCFGGSLMYFWSSDATPTGRWDVNYIRGDARWWMQPLSNGSYYQDFVKCVRSVPRQLVPQ